MENKFKIVELYLGFEDIGSNIDDSLFKFKKIFSSESSHNILNLLKILHNTKKIKNKTKENYEFISGAQAQINFYLANLINMGDAFVSELSEFLKRMEELKNEFEKYCEEENAV